MDPIHQKMNKEVMQFIKQLDADPNAERPTTFWFYSHQEENIYHLAHHLQGLNMTIQYCGEAFGKKHEYLLIAEKWMRPSVESMNNLWRYFTDIAERFDVIYDGWETRVEPG